MEKAPTFRFRLQFGARLPGKLPFSKPEVQVDVSEGLTFKISARNANLLDGATSFHIDATGFESVETATLAADALRIRLRLLNAVLGLGLNIPVGNTVSARFTEEIKNKLKSEKGVTVVDSVWGVSVIPDDGHHLECVAGGNLIVSPSSSEYLLEAIKELWNLNISLDKQSEDSLQILCLATQETSDKAAFLTSYLALEELVERRPRSDIAREVLQLFVKELEGFADDPSHSLLPDEASSLAGTLRALNEESFSSALVRLGKQISQPKEICGMPVTKFLSACIEARNKIAHHAEPKTKIPLGKLSKSLREFVLMLIWTRNKLPDLTLTTPPSALGIPLGGFSIRFM